MTNEIYDHAVQKIEHMTKWSKNSKVNSPEISLYNFKQGNPTMKIHDESNLRSLTDGMDG
jgi:hypothetical protein